VKAAIAIDPWKLSIFERHLAQAGYSFENSGLLTKGALILKVNTENAEALHEVIRAANTEAAMTGAPT
jgi:hypothetical protein